MDPATRGHDGEGAGGGDAQRVHRLADDVFAQHRADRGQTVAASRERRGSRTLEVKVTNRPVVAGDLAEQKRASVTEPRDESAELVAGIGRRAGRGAAGHKATNKDLQSSGALQPARIQAHIGGKPLIEYSSCGSGGTSA